MMLQKTCTKCREAKPVTAFSKDACKRDGLRSTCKECHASVSAKYRVAHPEKVGEAISKWRAAHPEKQREYATKYYAANSEKVREYKVKYRTDNPEKVRECKAKYRTANPDKCRTDKHNRRARKFEAGGTLSPGLANKLLRLQRGRCACCKHALGNKYHRDHIMPLALGGPNTDENIQLLCPVCNMQKHAKHPIDFMQQRGFLL